MLRNIEQQLQEVIPNFDYLPDEIKNRLVKLLSEQDDPMPQFGTNPQPVGRVAQQMPTQPTQAKPDMDWIKMMQNSGNETVSQYGGYAAAAAAFSKFVDMAFDSDSPLGDIGRRNIHWLEDGFRGIKDTADDLGFRKIKHGIKDLFGMFN